MCLVCAGPGESDHVISSSNQDTLDNKGDHF